MSGAKRDGTRVHVQTMTYQTRQTSDISNNLSKICRQPKHFIAQKMAKRLLRCGHTRTHTHGLMEVAGVDTRGSRKTDDHAWCSDIVLFDRTALMLQCCIRLSSSSVRYVLYLKLLLTAYRKSYLRNRFVPN